jgi:hypothetical protein
MNEHAGIEKHFCMEEIHAIVAHFSSQISVLELVRGPLYRILQHMQSMQSSKQLPMSSSLAPHLGILWIEDAVKLRVFRPNECHHYHDTGHPAVDQVSLSPPLPFPIVIDADVENRPKLHIWSVFRS